MKNCIAILTFLCVLFSVNVYGQWLHGQCPVGVSPYIVDAMTSWDPDGAGPQSEVLVVGGWFNSAGGKTCNYIATWDGITWEPLGAGLSGGFGVSVLEVYNGQPIAGGNFTASDGVPMPGVARWDGNQWQAMGSETSYIRGLVVFNNQLFAAGTYTVGGDTERIMRWDGDHWIPVSGNIVNGVSSLIVYNDLLIVESYSSVMAWDGSMGWTVFGDFDGPIYVLGVWNNKLIAGGSFNFAGGDYIAQWDGSTWQSVGGGVNGWVTGITTLGSDLYIAGDFTQAGSVDCSHIARWDGTQWTPLGGGLDDRGESLYHVMALYSWNGGIYEGGANYKVDGLETNYIARWQNNKWHALGNGMDGVTAFLADGDDLYAGGPSLAGGVVCNGIARWDGQEWNPVGEGLDTSVLSLVKYNGNILAGSSGYEPIDINQWNGSEWLPFGTSFEFDDWYMPEAQINVMSVQSGNLVVGGRFNKVDGMDCGNIALWNGSSWNTLEGGMGMYDRVHALAEYNGQLIAGGSFYTAGAVDCNNIARWDGTQWTPMGSGFDSEVDGLAVYNGDLIAVGYFTYAGSVECKSVARWNGSEWLPMGTLPGDFINVKTVKVYKNRLYVGGYFNSAQSGNIFVWDGSQWLPLDSGVDGQVDVLEVYGEELIVGGSFTNAGGQPSDYWARWIDSALACGAWGYFPADIDQNCRVEFADFAKLGQNWLTGGCITPLWCQGADVDENGTVGLSDLLEMADQWLNCTEPQGSGCVDQTF